jgi:DNA polymerase I-like protein with 3'-5' exonuclease and polymerase domains
MEVNGLKFDYESAKDMELKLMKRINELETLIKFQYNLHVTDISWSDFNFNSHDHIKVLLHGGKRIEEKRIPNGLFKSGFKEGQVRYKIEKVEHCYLTMIDPELQRNKINGDRYISVDVKVLKNYAPKDPVVKQILDAIIERSKLNKILGTYLKGLIDLREEKDWRDGLLHPNYNQCVVKTGRLSSSSPNGQNLAGDILNLIVSRYDD